MLQKGATKTLSSTRRSIP